MNSELPVAVTIAGSDSGGGAGVQADLLTFAAQGVFGTTAITCLTAQNPEGVAAVEAMAPTFVRAQLEQLAAFFALRAAKTGMLFDAGIVEAVAAFLAARSGLPVVVDPVMVATSGAVLLREDAIAAVREHLLPRAALVTPNLDEAAVLLGRRPADEAAMAAAAAELAGRFGVPFLVKGGHLTGEVVVDVLAWPGGGTRTWRDRRIDGVDTHGSGCTLSAAVAAQLARGAGLEEAVAAARAYLRAGLERPLAVGGRRFIAHGVAAPGRVAG
jgi:hydroxymethylpyrimidine/phosphomethylpyrimidine kinase